MSRDTLDTIPKDFKRLRACMGCSLIKSFEQFQRDGCENCEEALRFRRDPYNVYLMTSRNFSGMIAVIEPSTSWVCQWTRLNTCCPGMYAISVQGKLPREKINRMRRLGMVAVSRDRSV